MPLLLWFACRRPQLALSAGWLGMALSLGAPLLGQDLQLGLERLTPRPLQINPPTGSLRLDAAASQAPALRFGWDLWHLAPHQVLELGAGYRWASERQLTFANSVGAAGDVQARLQIGTQYSLGALYRYEQPWQLPLELGIGLEERRERMVLSDSGLSSFGSLDRPWLRTVLRHRFGADGTGPFVALEWALPLHPAPTPSGVNYLLDLDHLGSSPNPGTAALAHAPSYGLTLAIGYRFGGRPRPVPEVVSSPVMIETVEPPERELAPVAVALPMPLEPVPLPEVAPPPVPAVIVLDEAALHFALDRADLPPQGLVVLRAWASRIKAMEQAPRLSLLGNSDSTGTLSHNLRLSLARAQAVAAALRGAGVAVDRVTGMGPEQPVASNDSVAGRARNRRVEIHLDGLAKTGVIASEPVPETTPHHPLPKK
jgi:outer membrane protein OmpA-like peptidoglycan-associated protein